MQFPATLVFGFWWQKSLPPPPSGNRENFLDWIYPFHAISSNFGFCGRKVPPPPDEGKFFTLDLSISCNFQQLWFLVAEKPHGFWQFAEQLAPKIFLHWNLSISCEFPATLVFGLAEKPPPPTRVKRENFFTLVSIHFMQFPSNFGFWWQKSPPPPGTGKILLMYWLYPFDATFPATLVFLVGEKFPPTVTLLTIYKFYTGSILKSSIDNWEKSSPTSENSTFVKFKTGSWWHFMQFPATLVFCLAWKAPPPGTPGKTFL